jgi:uncharacterized Zn-binding protein involved in type VI secretion
MPSGLKTAIAAALLNLILRGTAFTTPTTPIKVVLTTTAPTATSNGTPVAGGSYADQTLTIASNTATNSISNSSTVSFTGMPATTTVGADIKDSAGSPVYFAWGTFASSITTLAGDTISFAAGAISAALNNTP